MWDTYLKIFKERWGLDRETCERVAMDAGDIFEAEFQEFGTEAYARSVVLPIRNAVYQAIMLPHRWAEFRKIGISDPVLDYGCGVGLLSNWLWHKGHREIYGYEPPGVQQEIMARSFDGKDGIYAWDGKTPGHFNTVICINVLEHVEDPVALLNKLYKLSNRVIANVHIDEEDRPKGSHIASKESMRECKKVLERAGTLFEYSPQMITDMKNGRNSDGLRRTYT